MGNTVAEKVDDNELASFKEFLIDIVDSIG
jgi:hypothetical protein